jgi:replication factor C large subunit
VLIYGPPGVGKTSSVYAIANDNNYEVIEVNASDFRNKEKINQTVGNALKQGSLFGKKKLILVDEVDGLSGTKDRGATQEIMKLTKSSTFPVVLTAQNPFSNKFSSIRSKSVMIPFKELNYTYIYDVLKKICLKENIYHDDSALKSLARFAGGDLRSAINDLEGLAANKSFTKEDLKIVAERDREESMPQALIKILKNSNINIARHAFDNVIEDLDQQFLWLDKNMPNEYEGEDIAKAYDWISRADIFKRRIRRWQHWRFLVYINAFLTAGVASSKEKKYDKFIKYQPTGRLLKIFWANQKSAKKKAISEKIAARTHQSKKDVIQDFGYYKQILMKEKSFDEFDLDKDEIEYLKK